MELSASERARYSRHLLLPEIGVAGQQSLRAARVLVVGAGGLGSPCAMYLAAAGIGTLGIIDGDRVDVSNLQRQLLFDSADLGAPKAQAAQARLRALNPEIEVRAHQGDLTAANAGELLAEYQIIVDGSDRLATRYLVNDACVLHARPLVTAAIHRFEGQAMTFVPGRGPCYRCLFPDTADDVVPNCATAGVLGVLPGVMGSLQATEVIKLITGAGEVLTGRLLTYDALTLQFQEFRFARRADCAVCGESPSILSLRDAAPACAATETVTLSAMELAALIAERDPLLIDVRGAAEFALGHLPGARNLPLETLAGRCAELPAGRTLVFICAAGVRSRQACQVAAANGRPDSASLTGGVQAWPGELVGS